MPKAPDSAENAREDVGQDPVPHLFAGKVENWRQANDHTGLEACHVLRSSGRESGGRGGRDGKKRRVSLKLLRANVSRDTHARSSDTAHLLNDDEFVLRVHGSKSARDPISGERNPKETAPLTK